MSDTLDEYKDDFGLFIEAGFVAAKQMDEKSARQIFKAAQVLNPESVSPQVGLGYIALNKMDTKESDRIFEKVVEKEPENWLAVCFLGVSYVLQKEKRKEGEELILKALEGTDDETVRTLAKTSLEWNEKDLKKKDSKAPFFKKNES
ncbi:hypothetical protein N9Y92_01275 [Chlamydiales bacterium]|nr:hypothetical protein [Chlamydiales bacterium]